MNIEMGTYKSTTDDGVPLHFEIRAILEPGGEFYPRPRPDEIREGNIDIKKYGKENIVSFNRLGALYFPTVGMMFESDLIKYLETHGYEYEEERDG